MTIETGTATSTTELDHSTAQIPAAVADDKNTGAEPAPGADDQNAEAVTETPEQQAAKPESRRARQNARRTAELVEARTEARIYKEQLEALKGKYAPQQQADAAPKREDYPDYETYLEARTDYRADQKVAEVLRKRDEAQQSTQRQQQTRAVDDKVVKAWTDAEKTYSAATKDYAEVVTPFVEEELQSFSLEARRAIVESDVGPALLYYLANNAEVADKIAAMSPARQAMELGKLEAKLPAPKAAKTTSAPPPANTTIGNKTGSKDPEKMSQSEYEAWRKSGTEKPRWAH